MARNNTRGAGLRGDGSGWWVCLVALGILMLRVPMVLVMYYRTVRIVVVNELVVGLMVLYMRLSRCMVVVMLMIMMLMIIMRVIMMRVVMMRVVMMPTECPDMRAHRLVFSLGKKLHKL